MPQKDDGKQVKRIVRLDRRSCATLFFFLVLAAVAGFRLLGLDRDFEQYEIFYSLSDYGISLSRFEPGFRWIALTSHDAGLSFFGFLLVVSSVSVALKIYAIKAYDYRELAPWIYYLSYYYVLLDMTAIRFGLALALILLSLRLFYSGSRILGLVCAGASLLFHLQAALPILAFTALGLVNHFNVRHRLFFGLSAAILSGGVIYLGATLTDVTQFGQAGEWAVRYIETDRGYGAAWYQPSVVMSIILLCLGRVAIHSPDRLVRTSWYVGCLGVFTYYLLSNVGVLAFRASDSLTFFNVLWLGYAAKHSKPAERRLIYVTLGLFVVFFYFVFFLDEAPYLRFHERWAL